MSYRDEFSVKTRKAAYKRADGTCECGCGMPFGKERVEYDHELPDFLGGTNDLENCKAIRLSCHKLKTIEDMQTIKKARRIQNKQRGFVRAKPVMAGSKKSKWKHKVNGDWVLRD